MRFEPKRDNAYVFIIFLVSVPLFISVVIYLIVSDGDWTAISIVSAIGIVMIIWFLSVWFGTYYVITDDFLIIKQGPFQKKIDLYSIQKIEKSYMVSASVTLSIERYNLHYDQSKTAIISPKGIEQFVKQIEQTTNKKIELFD